MNKIIEGKEVKGLSVILQRLLLTYRTTPHCQTHKLPVELLFNMKLDTRLNCLKPTLSNTITSHEDNFSRFHYYSKKISINSTQGKAEGLEIVER